MTSVPTLIEISRADHRAIRTRSIRASIANCWRFRRLLVCFVRQDLIAPDRYSLLSLFWLFFTPVAGVFSWLILDGIGVLRPGNTGVPYALYAFQGSLWWGLFLTLHMDLSALLFRNRQLFSQSAEHRDIVVAALVISSLVRFSIVWVLVACVAVVSGVVFFHWQLLLTPLVGMPLVATAVGTGLLMAPIAGIAPDIQRLVQGALALLFYGAPIIYVPGAAHFPLWLDWLVRMNPFGYLVALPRDLLLSGYYPALHWLCSALVGSAAIAAAGWFFFIRSEPYVSERIV